MGKRIFKEKEEKTRHRTPINRKEKYKLLDCIYSALDRLKFSTPEKRQTQKIVWKRVINQAQLMEREAFALFGFFKKIK